MNTIVLMTSARCDIDLIFRKMLVVGRNSTGQGAGKGCTNKLKEEPELLLNTFRCLRTGFDSRQNVGSMHPNRLDAEHFDSLINSFAHTQIH